ncbi:hypothetical protein GCM10009739_31340 [Microbacterium ulmi]
MTGEGRLADADDSRDEHALRFAPRRCLEERVEKTQFSVPPEQGDINTGRPVAHDAHCRTAAQPR